MVSVKDGHISFHGLPVQIVYELCIAITALLADTPEKVRPSMREIVNRCFDRATTDDAIEMFLHDSSAYAEEVIKDTDLFSMLSIFRKFQEGMKKAMEEQEDDE